MGSDRHRGELIRLQKELASLHADIGKHEAAAAKARAEAARRRKAASDTKSALTEQMHLRAAETEDKKVVAATRKVGELRGKVVAATRKVGELRGKVASVAEKQRRSESNLSSALEAERAAAQRAENAQKRKEKYEREVRDREEERRRRSEKDHVREISRLASITVRHVLEREPEPETLRLLYLTSSPGDREALRVDAEVNNVMKALRGAKLRDLIELHLRPAATREDVVDGINDLRPHVIHFSGHGGSDGLVFDNAGLDLSAGLVFDFATLARILKATNLPPTLAVLNACRTLEGAEALLEAVPVVIAMSGGVADMAAGLFATHFYAAIGGAQSIGHAVEQARAMISLALPDEPDHVEVRAASGVEIDQLFLVTAT